MGSIPGSGRSLEKERATHSRILAQEIPQTEEPEGQSTGSQRVGHNSNALQDSCPGNPTDRGAGGTVHGVTKSRSQLRRSVNGTRGTVHGVTKSRSQLHRSVNGTRIV